VRESGRGLERETVREREGTGGRERGGVISVCEMWLRCVRFIMVIRVSRIVRVIKVITILRVIRVIRIVRVIRFVSY
jgi:hypothetical protein